MPTAAYFDTSLWIAVLADEPPAGDVLTLIEEIKHDRGRIVTSILTLTEISVRAYQKAPARVAAGVQLVSAVSAICAVSQDVALLTAKIEATFMASVWQGTLGNRKRRWDALHLATAATYAATVFYTFDNGLLGADFSALPAIPPVRRPQPLQGSLV